MLEFPEDLIIELKRRAFEAENAFDILKLKRGHLTRPLLFTPGCLQLDSTYFQCLFSFNEAQTLLKAIQHIIRHVR